MDGLMPSLRLPSALTVHKLLLLWGDDAAQVGLMLSASGLCIHPSLPVFKVPVAVALELGPAFLTVFLVWNTQRRDEKELVCGLEAFQLTS